jgi:multidrug efflux pump subunit AcrA (membrane-fusion protein)
VARPVLNAAAAAVSTSGSRAVVWLLGEDDKPVPVRVTLGRSHESATELVDGSLRAGQQVIIGTSAAQDHSWFGFSWRL